MNSFRRPLLALAAIAVALPAAAAGAQQPARPRPAAPKPAAPPAKEPAKTPATAPAAQPAAPAVPSFVLVGTVVDSIHNRPLAGATVIVDAAGRLAITDSLGNFRIDSVPTGTWRLAFFHPMLDTLALSIATHPIEFGTQAVQYVALTTPSTATLAAGWCAPATRRLGVGALLGRVVDAESGEPVVGARTSLVFEEAIGLTGVAVRRVPRVRTAAADSAGRFALCGLPESMTGTLQVERPGVKTPEIPVELDESGHAMHVVLVAPPPRVVAAGDSAAPAERLRGSASLRGRVTGPDGRPLAGARVSVDGTGAETTTDAAGNYSMSDLPAGTWTVRARRVGATPEPRVISLGARAVAEVSFALKAAPTQLETVVVRDAATSGLTRAGFDNRMSSGLGRYVTPEDIDQMKPQRTTDVLRGIAGVLIVPDGRGRNSIRGTRGCMNVYVDGMHAPDAANGDLDSHVPGTEVAAVEVYNSSLVPPPEFQPTGRGNCGAVVVWTRTRARSK